MGPLTFKGPFCFCVALLHLNRAINYYQIGPFHPREDLPSWEGSGVVGVGSGYDWSHKARDHGSTEVIKQGTD